jgi:uncharacterized membrane protein
VFDSIFRTLFKYERLVFEQGQFVLGATQSMWFVAAITVAAALYVLWTYQQLTALRGRDKIVLSVARVALLAVALFAVLRPMLLLKVAVPQQNFVGVVLDDSRSMQVADEADQARSQYVINQFGKPDTPLMRALGERFVTRVFRFSSVAERLQSTTDLTFQGTGTRFSDALSRIRDEMSGLPVAGLVVVSDGADTSETTLDQALAGLRSQALPVFTVGVGKERLSRDVQITRAETPSRVLKGASLVVDVVVTQSGYAGAKVPLLVEEDGKTVSTQDITLPADGESQTVRVRFKATTAGAGLFRFRVPLQANEEVTQNNQRDSLIDVYDRPERILHIEGEPRPEPKFIWLATEDDQNVRIAWVQRTAEATVNAPNKYYRRGMTTAEELQDGFPSTREELFKFRSIILGSIEASALAPDQQRMLEDFVDVRGGSLLVLGGLRSFSEGGWAGTPLSDALPVNLDTARAKPLAPPLEIVVRPTRAGDSHPAAQITERPEDAAAKWKEMPPLTAVNLVPVSDLKPGANALLTGVDQNGREQVVLAYQRYGRGKVLVLPVQDTWMWRMNANMAVEDMTHHNFWRRLTRWLVDGVPDRVMVSSTPDRVQRGEPITLTADVVDPEYRGVNDGRITAHATAPSGRVEDVPMEWTVENDGEYRARFTPSEDGLYRIAVDGTSQTGADVGRGTVVLRVAPSDAEYFDAAMRPSLLRRLSEETGGRFFRSADTTGLVDAISYSGRGVTVIEERELWDMPVVLVLLLGLMGGEWLYRRRRGVA